MIKGVRIKSSKKTISKALYSLGMGNSTLVDNKKLRYNDKKEIVMKKYIIQQATHEFRHGIDDGEDYEKYLEFTSKRFNITKQELVKSYEKYTQSLEKKQPKMK